MEVDKRNENRVREALDIVVRAAALGDYDSNVIGMAAEVIAEDDFGMKKVPRGTRSFDGSWMRDGLNRTVQVKAWSESRILRYKHGTFLRLKEESLPDDLLLLLVYCSKPGYEVLYNGPANEVGFIEKRGTRAVRFDAFRSWEDIQLFLAGLI